MSSFRDASWRHENWSIDRCNKACEITKKRQTWFFGGQHEDVSKRFFEGCEAVTTFGCTYLFATIADSGNYVRQCDL